jgi:hypothetical protein
MNVLLALLTVFILQSPAIAADKPRIAIVIDDFGLTYKKNVTDEQWMALKYPMTFAVMPESPRTSEAARRTKESGHELIIHFPFDPFLKLALPKDKVSPDDLAKVSALLDKAFRQIPGSVGLNNHRSLSATKNRPLMEEFMKKLKVRGGYFLDSHVSPKSVAYDEAKKAGIAAARNWIFLEEPGHYNDKAFAAAMIRRAAVHARKEGQVVLIGHHYFHGTYDALVEALPKLEAEGFELVFASQLAR